MTDLEEQAAALLRRKVVRTVSTFGGTDHPVESWEPGTKTWLKSPEAKDEMLERMLALPHVSRVWQSKSRFGVIAYTASGKGASSRSYPSRLEAFVATCAPNAEGIGEEVKSE